LQAANEIDEWSNEISSLDQNLRKSSDNIIAPKYSRTIPAPRGSNQKVVVPPKASSSSRPQSNKESGSNSSESSTRISGYDFRAWEKYDVDKAVAEIDESEQRKVRELEQNKVTAESIARERKYRRDLRHKEEMARLQELLSISDLGPVQRQISAGAIRIDIQ